MVCPAGIFQNSLFRCARPSVALRCTVALVILAFCAVCTAVKIYERIYTITCFKRKMKNEKLRLPYGHISKFLIPPCKTVSCSLMYCRSCRSCFLCCLHCCPDLRKDLHRHRLSEVTDRSSCLSSYNQCSWDLFQAVFVQPG